MSISGENKQDAETENKQMREAIKDAYEYMCQWQIAKAKVTLFKWAVLK